MERIEIERKARKFRNSKRWPEIEVALKEDLKSSEINIPYVGLPKRLMN